MVNDLVITISGVSLGDVWLSVTSIPSISIGCSSLLQKSLNPGLADICTEILGGSKSNDWMSLSASFLLIYIKLSEMQNRNLCVVYMDIFSSTHTHTLTHTHMHIHNHRQYCLLQVYIVSIAYSHLLNACKHTNHLLLVCVVVLLSIH